MMYDGPYRISDRAALSHLPAARDSQHGLAGEQDASGVDVGARSSARRRPTDVRKQSAYTR